MTEPTPDLVRRFYAYMLGHFGGQVLDKQNATEMKAVALLLGQIGVLDRQRFLENFATTLGRLIYLPFEPGVPRGNWSLWKQIVVLTHECQHIVQYDRLGALKFGWSYLSSQAERAHLETEAYGCSLELSYWRFGTLPAAADVASSLRGYAVRDVDVKVAETMLRMQGEAVKHGAVLTEASRVALAWLGQEARSIRTVLEN